MPINRLLPTKSDRSLEDLQLAALYEETAPVLDHPEAVENVRYKYWTGARLAAADVPVSDAFFGRSPRTFEEWRDHLPGSAVDKRTVGTNGQEVSVVPGDDAIDPSIDDEQAFVREFLNDGDGRPYDVRAYVVGAMRRHAPEGNRRTVTAGVTDRSRITESRQRKLTLNNI